MQTKYSFPLVGLSNPNNREKLDLIEKLVNKIIWKSVRRKFRLSKRYSFPSSTIF